MGTQTWDHEVLTLCVERIQQFGSVMDFMETWQNLSSWWFCKGKLCRRARKYLNSLFQKSTATTFVCLTLESLRYNGFRIGWSATRRKCVTTLRAFLLHFSKSCYLDMECSCEQFDEVWVFFLNAQLSAKFYQPCAGAFVGQAQKIRTWRNEVKIYLKLRLMEAFFHLFLIVSEWWAVSYK